MLFIGVSLVVWIIFGLLLFKYKKDRFKYSEAILPLLLFSIMITVDLGINYLGTIVSADNSRSNVHGLISGFIIGDNNLTIEFLKYYYYRAFIITLAIFVFYCLSLFPLRKFGKKNKTRKPY